MYVQFVPQELMWGHGQRHTLRQLLIQIIVVEIIFMIQVDLLEITLTVKLELGQFVLQIRAT